MENYTTNFAVQYGVQLYWLWLRRMYITVVRLVGWWWEMSNCRAQQSITFERARRLTHAFGFLCSVHWTLQIQVSPSAKQPPSESRADQKIRIHPVLSIPLPFLPSHHLPSCLPVPKITQSLLPLSLPSFLIPPLPSYLLASNFIPSP